MSSSEAEPPLDPEMERILLLDELKEVRLAQIGRAAIHITDEPHGLSVLVGTVEPWEVDNEGQFANTQTFLLFRTSLTARLQTAEFRLSVDGARTRLYNLYSPRLPAGLNQQTATDDKLMHSCLGRTEFSRRAAKRYLRHMLAQEQIYRSWNRKITGTNGPWPDGGEITD